MKALIADDDVFVRKCLLKMLPWQELGFSQVLEAKDGASALKTALENAPDLIISDVKMPGMSGLKLAEELRASMVDVSVIILSEYSDFEFVQRALKIDVQDYILKPITKERLAEITEKIREMKARVEMKKNYADLRDGEDGLRKMAHDMLMSGDARACADTFEDLALHRIHPEDLKLFCFAFLREIHEQTYALTYKKQEFDSAGKAALAACAKIKNVADMISFVREQCAQCVQMCAKQSVRTTGYIQMIDDYIEAHYADPDLSVSAVSDWLHLSAVYTGTLYKQHKGTSIINRINEVRLSHAKELLLDVNENVRAISHRVGYVTPDYFSRLFSAAFGVSPSQYRAAMLRMEKTEDPSSDGQA